VVARLQERDAASAHEMVKVSVPADALTVNLAKMVAVAEYFGKGSFTTVQKRNVTAFNEACRPHAAGSAPWLILDGPVALGHAPPHCGPGIAAPPSHGAQTANVGR
jgi:hypothetical protein